jgi:subtilase family serine protease/C1A family cysteine protease
MILDGKNPAVTTRLIISCVLFLVLLLSISGLFQPVIMAQQQLPDLTITGAWLTDSQICYSIKNMGVVSAGGAGAPVSHYTALFVDGKQVAEDHITISIAPAQQLDRCFNYTFQMTLPQHTIRICADWKQNINESNEGNNCWEQVWEIEEELPDLIVAKIECGAGNKLSITIKNNGPGSLPTGWSASAQAYFNQQPKGVFSLQNPTSSLNGGISMPGGSSTYLLSWDVVAPTLVWCVIDINNSIREENEQNNSREESVAPLSVTCPEGCACLTQDEAKAQGYSLYCGGNQTLCGYDSNNTPMYCRARYLPPPDLIIRSVALIPLEANEYEIRYTVANWGRGDAPPSVTALYVDDTLVAEDDMAGMLSAEEREEVFAWHYNMASCTPASDTIRVVVDYRDEFDESYEDNNESSLTWECAETPPPDLHIRRVWTEPLGSGEHRIGYEIENIGRGPAPSSRTGLYVDGVFKAVDSVGTLAPLARLEKVFSYTYNLLSCTGDNDIIRIVVDFDDAIAETNEDNNEETLTWECPVRAKPDLVIHNVWWEADPGSMQNLSIHYSIENRSLTPVGSTITGLWINDARIATDSVPPLDGLEVLSMVTFPRRWTPQVNDNHVRICADVSDDVDESTVGETNNCLEKDWTFELSCWDRFQSRDEEGIDCGGSYCAPCNRCGMILPDRFDWRDYCTLPPIEAQGDCGSCWAFSAVGAIMGTYAVESGATGNLSEQFAICECSGDCDGGCDFDVFRYARDHGIVDLDCQPYLASNSPCNKCSDWRSKLWRIREYGRVSSNIQDIKRALICYGPLSVGSENWKHFIVIVGYDDNMVLNEYKDGRISRTFGPGCWIIRNSWGWGYGYDNNGDGIIDDPGYGLIPYSGHDYSDIKDYVHYIRGVIKP